MDYIAGVVLQYLRSAKKFPEWATVVFIVVIAGLTFVLSPAAADFHPSNAWEGFRLILAGTVDHIVKLLATQGGTSIVANIAASAKPELAASPLVPVTDSL